MGKRRRKRGWANEFGDASLLWLQGLRSKSLSRGFPGITTWRRRVRLRYPPQAWRLWAQNIAHDASVCTVHGETPRVLDKHLCGAVRNPPSAQDEPTAPSNAISMVSASMHRRPVSWRMRWMTGEWRYTVLSSDHTAFAVAWLANRRSPTPPSVASLSSPSVCPARLGQMECESNSRLPLPPPLPLRYLPHLYRGTPSFVVLLLLSHPRHTARWATCRTAVQSSTSGSLPRRQPPGRHFSLPHPGQTAWLSV